MSRLSELVRRPEFRVGAREMLLTMPGISAWGLVTGVAMVKGGLSVPLALFMNFAVFAGSSQLAAIPLFAAGAPLWVVWATAFCVNLRFVIFSAQWRPYLMHLSRPQRLLRGYFSGDIIYVMFMRRFPVPGRIAEERDYFLGASVVNFVMWHVPSVIGIVAAHQVPTEWGLGFAGVLALLGLTYALVSDRVTALAAAVAGAAAIAAFALPFRLHIVVAIAAAVTVGLIWDAASGRGSPPKATPVEEAT